MDQKNNDTPSDEELKELEELIESLKKLEEQQKNQEQKSKKRPKGILTIEFGGVYHRNIIVNFLFSLIINITLAYLVIQMFDFAEFDHLNIYLIFITVYTIIEGLVKTFITIKFFKFIIQSMGFILYLAYLLIFYILDVYLFEGNFTFNHAYHIVAFTTIFIIIRYFVSIAIKRYLRSRTVR